jgi:hypothetical protein
VKRIALASGEHQRQAKACLKLHLLASAAALLVESEQLPLRPALAFGQHRHGEQDRRGGRRKAQYRSRRRGDMKSKAAFIHVHIGPDALDQVSLVDDLV